MTVGTDDIETALGRSFSAEEQAQANQWIDDALMLIEARLGDLDELNENRLNYVVREAVVARFRNPDGHEYESIDDYRYGLPKETQRITILPEWWSLLSPTTETTMFSVRPSFAADTTPDPYLSL